MVNFRYKFIVKDALNRIGIQFKSLKLGELEIDEPISFDHKEHLKKVLLDSGLEFIEDKKSRMIDKIKNIFIGMVNYSDENHKVNFSNHLIENLHYDYTYLRLQLKKNQKFPITSRDIFSFPKITLE